MNLPIFEATIDETTGVTAVALVDRPAIERSFQAFNQKHAFKATDEARKIVSGPLMIPAMPIYRKDETGEYMVFFSKDTIEKIGMKFMAEARNNAVNMMHDPNAVPEGTFLFESFFIDSARGIKAPEGFGELPDGTWFGSYKVDDKTWNEFITTGVFTGFSIEGVFIHTPVDQTEVQIREYVESVFGKNYENQQFVDMIKFKEEFAKRFPSFFNEPAPAPDTEPVKLTEATLTDGTVVVYDGELTAGTTLFVRTDEGDMPAPAGVHEVQTEGGVKLVTVDETGVVVSIEDVAQIDEMEQFKAARLQFEQDVLSRLDALTAKLEGPNKEVTELKEAIAMMAEYITPEPENKPTQSTEKKDRAMGFVKALAASRKTKTN